MGRYCGAVVSWNFVLYPLNDELQRLLECTDGNYSLPPIYLEVHTSFLSIYLYGTNTPVLMLLWIQRINTTQTNTGNIPVNT